MKHILSPSKVRLTLYAVVTFCIVYAVHGYCRLYFDDYAYAGLTYFYTIDGTYEERFSLFNLFKYLYEHYMGWGGRVVAFFLAIPLMHAGPEYFWFVQSIVVSAILLCSTLMVQKLADDKNHFLVYYLAILLGYFIIPPYAAKDGLYWAAASSAYVWPAAFFLSSILLLQKPSISAGRTVAITLLIFLAAASAEMYAVITLATMGCLFFCKWYFSRQFDKHLLFFFFIALTGFSFMVLAPGNFARAMVQNAQRPGLMEMIQGLIADFPTLFEKLLYPADHRFNVMLVLCLCGIVYNLVMLFKKRDATAICAASLSVGFLAAISVFLIPEARGGRMLLPLFLLSPVIGAPLLVHVIRLAGSKLTIAALAALLITPTQDYIQTYKGYKANYPVIVASDKELENYKPGDTSLTFYILPDDTYAAFMPYHKPVRFAEYFARSRYDIPQFVQFIYSKKYLPESWQTETDPGLMEFLTSGPQKNCELNGWVPRDWGLLAENSRPEIRLLTKAPLKTLELELVALIDDEKGSQSVEIYIDDTPVTKKTRINAVPTYFTITIPEESQKKLAETGVLTLNFHLPDIDPMPQATPIPGTHPVSVGLRSLRILP